MKTGTARRKRKTENFSRYSGEWVALIGNRVVGHNKNLEVLMRDLEGRNLHRKATVLLIPRKDEGPYIFILG